MTGYDWLFHVNSGYVTLCQVRTDYECLDQVWSD